MVKSLEDVRSGWDFPGGKLLWSEDVFSCAEREALEESRYKVKLVKFLGIYQRKTGANDEDYFRFIFIGKIKDRGRIKEKNPNISDVKWLKIDDLLKNKLKVRSPEVIREVANYASGRLFPLNAVELYVW